MNKKGLDLTDKFQDQDFILWQQMIKCQKTIWFFAAFLQEKSSHKNWAPHIS